jgi:hypothetical protein
MRKLWPILIVSLCVFSSCSIIKTVKTFNGGDDLPIQGWQQVDFEMIDNTMLVKVRINDSEKEYNFIFDTGAINVIDNDLAAEFGLQRVSKVKAKDSGNLSSETGVFVADKLTMGNVSVVNTGIVTLDLDFVEDILGTKVDGIIGNNFLRYFTVRLDYRDSIISFSKVPWPINTGQNAYVTDFKQNLSTGLSPYVECDFGGYKIDGYIDCGNSGHITFPNPLVEESDILKFPHLASYGASSGGAFGLADSSKNYIVRAENFSVGSYIGKDILLTTGEGETCLIGNEFLSQFEVVIDYPSSKLILIPASYNVIFDANPKEKGFSAYKEETGFFRVIYLVENSSAFEAGLRNGDLIISINQIDCIDVTNSEFRKVLDEVDSVNLTIERNSEKLEIVVKDDFLFK